MLFERVQKPCGKRNHGEIIGAHGNEYFCKAESVRCHNLAFAHQFHAGNKIGEGAVLDQIDNFIAAARQGAPRGLGGDNPEHGLDARKAKRFSRQYLPLAD